MLQVKNLTISYWDVTPVRDISFSLDKGSIGCVVGLSGVGKSTLARGLCGILEPASGTMALDDAALSPATHKIGYVAQDYSLYPWKTVRENILLAVKIKRQKPDETLFLDIISALGLEAFLHKYPASLSGGQKQRVALARSFFLSPDLLIMDEPFSALDEITRQEAKELFRSVWNEYKPTTILITHSIDEAVSLGHKLFMQGKDSFEEINLAENDDKDAVKHHIRSRLAVANA